MSETKNLRLFKHNEPLETNENKFDIDLALNQNWDKIEEFAGMVNDKVIELEDKDEEQDFNLQELQNEIKKDRKNMINLETEGQSIHIEDSSDLEGKLEVLGNMEQDVREGYNLYDYMSRVIATTKGLNVTKDTENGYLIVNGTPETDYTSITAGTNITDKIKDKTTYSLWQEKYDGKLFLQVNAKKKDASGYDYFSVTSAKKDFTVDKSKYGDYTMVIQTGLKTQAGTFNNYKNRYMLYEGTEEKTYEQYGASPSPEFPSVIRAVGDNVNLLENTAKTQTVNGVTFTANEDGSIIANGIAEAEASLTINNQINLGKGEYCISGCPKGGGNNTYRIGLWNNTWESIALDLGDSSNFTLQQNTEAIKCAINIKQGTTVKNVVFKPKIEKGTVATSYSKFGQGSVEIKKQNKNIMPINTEFYELISNGIKIKSDSMSKKITEFKIKKGQKVEIALKLITKTTTSTSFTFHTNGVGNTELGFININTYNLNQIYKKTYIATEDTVIDCALWGNEKKEIFEFQFWAEMINATEYTEHQEQTKILPIQKPMLEGDYFVKEVDGWEEAHTWKKIILTGQENTWQLYTSGVRRFGLDLTKDLPKKETGKYATGYCTHFKVDTKMTTDLTMFLQVELGHFYVGIIDQNSKWVDVNTLKSELQRLYNAGTPVILYYKLETPSKLPCTPEQTEILDELDNFQTYKPVTNVTTDSIAKLKLKYIADTKTYVDNKVGNLEKQVNTINQLLSTTKTSSILLDNLQTDIESEVL